MRAKTELKKKKGENLALFRQEYVFHNEIFEC